MEYSIYDAIRAGFNHGNDNKKTNKEYLDEYLNKRLPKHIKIDIVVKRQLICQKVAI